MKLAIKFSVSSLAVLTSFSLNASNNLSGLSSALPDDTLNIRKLPLNIPTPIVPVNVKDIEAAASKATVVTSLPSHLNEPSLTSSVLDIGAPTKLIPVTDNTLPASAVKPVASLPTVNDLPIITPPSVISTIATPTTPLPSFATDPLIKQIPNASAAQGSPSLPITSVPSTNTLGLPVTPVQGLVATPAVLPTLTTTDLSLPVVPSLNQSAATVPTTPIKFDPADYNQDGNVSLVEEITYGVKTFKDLLLDVIHHIRVTKNDLKHPDLAALKSFLNFKDFGGGAVVLDDLNKHAKHFDNFIIGYRTELTKNVLFTSLPPQAQDVINNILNTSEKSANLIAHGSGMSLNFAASIQSDMQSLSEQITSNKIDPNYIAAHKDYLTNFVKLIDAWKASGNTSQAATTILNYLKNIK